MSIYSRTLKHVNHKDFRRTHQRHLGEQKVLRKIEEEKLIQEKKKLEEIKKISSPLKSNWRKDLLREFGEWVPIANAGGPTMGTSTTFGYYVGGTPLVNGETGQPITYTASGLGGSDGLPTTVTIDQGAGEIFNVAAPTYNQLSLAGYASPLPFLRRSDLEDVNAMLDASQQFAQAVGADYMMNARVEYEPEKVVKVTTQDVQPVNYEYLEKKYSEMISNASNYASKLGVDLEELHKRPQIDKYGRLVVLNYDGTDTNTAIKGVLLGGLKWSNNAYIKIFNPDPAKGAITYTGIKPWREVEGVHLLGTSIMPNGEVVQSWSPGEDVLGGALPGEGVHHTWDNVAPRIVHYTDFGPGHDPNKIGEVLVGPKIVGPKSDNTISAYAAYLKSLPPGVRNDMLRGGKTAVSPSPLVDLAIMGLSVFAIRAILKSRGAIAAAIRGKPPGPYAGQAPRPPRITPTSKEVWNTHTGKYETIKNTDPGWDWAQRALKDTGPNSIKHYEKTGELPSGLQGWRPNQAFDPTRPASAGGPGSMPTPQVMTPGGAAATAGGFAAGSAIGSGIYNIMQKNSYEPQGQLISESRQRILRKIKQPAKLKESTTWDRVRKHLKGA